MANEFIARKGLISKENVKAKQYRYYAYDPLLTYNIGDGIEKDNEELICNTDGTTGTFNIAKWQRKGSDQNFTIICSNAASFDGRYTYIDTNQTFQTTFQNDFTIECYINPVDGQPTSNQYFFGSVNAAVEDRILLYIDTSGNVTAIYESNNNSVTATGPSVLSNGTQTNPTKVKVVVNSTNITVYQDDVAGTPVSTAGLTMGDFATDQDCYIGAYNNNGTETSYFQGQVFDLKIRDNDDTTVAHWPMAEGYNNTVFDVSGNEYHGTANLTGIRSTWDLNSSPTATVTSNKGAGYTADLAFDTDLTIDGAYLNNAWVSADASVTNQRLVVDLGSTTIIRNIRIANSHDSGSNEDTGVKTTVIYVSDNASDYTGVYGTDNAQTQIWSGIVPKHTASDIKEFFDIYLDESEKSGRYLIFEFADNWGDATNMAVRRIEVSSSGRSKQNVFHYNASYGFNMNVAEFNGSSEYIDTNQSFQSTFQNDFEFNATIWPDDGQPAANQVIFGAVNSDDSDEFTVYLDTSGNIKATYTANTNTVTATGPSALSDGTQTKPVKVKVVANSTNIQVFIDDVEGTAVSTAAITFSEYTSSDNPYIGAQNDNGSDVSYFDGKIWDVKLYDNTSSLDAEYPLTDGSGTTIVDTVGTNGTASANTIWSANSYLKRSKIPVLLDGTSDIYGSANISNPYEFGKNGAEGCFRKKNGIVQEFIIDTESDLPLSDDGTRYVLQTGTYVINGSVTVTKPIDKSRDSGVVTVRGVDISFSILSSSLPAIFDIPYLDSNLIIETLSLISLTGAIFDINNPDIGGSVIVESCFLGNSASVGNITGTSFISRFNRLLANDQGFVFENSSFVLVIDNVFNLWNNTAGCTYFEFKGTFSGGITMVNNFIETAGSNETIFDFDASLTLDGAKVSNNSFDTSAGGNYFDGTSRDQTDPYIIFQNNIGISDSKTNTLINIGANTTDTVIVAQNAITLAASDDWSNEITERFTIDASGVAEYTGREDTILDIVSPFAMEPASGTNKDLIHRTVNIHGHTDYVVTFTNATNLINETSTALTNGDTISFYNTPGTLPAELYENIIYYVVNKTTNSFQVSYTSGGAAIAFTDDGTPTNSYNNADMLGITASARIDAGSPSNITTVALSSVVTGDQIAGTVTNTTDTIDITINSGGLKIISP